MKAYKGYLIKPSKNSPMNYCVVTEGQGGKIPNVLDSLFTSTGLAMAAIDEYLDNKPVKEPKNGKARSESGD
jgi:hypothetical protein